jgi:hypothetical protein
MSDETGESTATAQPTDVRFSTRSLLMVMVGVALAASALGPYFRNLKPEERTPIAALWSVCGVFVLTWVGYHARTRYQLERQAGRTIMAFIVGGCLWIAAGIYWLLMSGEELSRAQSSGSPLWSILFRGVFSAMFIALGIATIWWNQRIQLREHGVLRGLKLLRWSHVTSNTWGDGALTLDGVDQRHHDIRLAMNVPTEQLESVIALVAEKLSDQFQQPRADSTASDSALVASPAIVITPSDEVTLRRVLSIIGIYIATILLIVLLPWGTPPREFFVGLTIGFITAVLMAAYRKNRTRLSSTPRVRLGLRIDWLRAAVVFAVMLGCYYIVQHVSFTSPMLAGVLGFMTGVCAFVVLGMFVRDKFDLCDNGVVISQWDFWPWDGIRVAKWNRDGNGRLTLTYGWRRIHAKVPSDKRLTVDQILKVQAGENHSA